VTGGETVNGVNAANAVNGGLWLSRLRLDARHPEVSKAICDAQALHALTMRCLPPGVGRAEAGLLHHADLASGMLLVQSAVRPQWPTTGAFHAQAKEITPFVQRLGRGDVLRFTVRAVPMRRRSPTLRDGSSTESPGEHALRTDAERVAWLEQRLETAARLHGPAHINAEPARSGYRRGNRFVHRPVLFAGVIEVCDAGALRELIATGVGRVKSYGNGLLMLGRTAP
jgi:CRISPR system Cascade subunit CasE